MALGRGLLALVALLAPGVVSAGNNAAWTSPAGTWISEFSGKMNVPKPSKTFYRGHPLFLWPGLDPTGQATGLFQPVLTLGQGGNTPEKPWTIANWFSRCGPYNATTKTFGAKYCHDDYQNVHEVWYLPRPSPLPLPLPLLCSCRRRAMRTGGRAELVCEEGRHLQGIPHGVRDGLEQRHTRQKSVGFRKNVSMGAHFMWATEAEAW